MPVEDFTNIDLGIDEKTFDQLDKSAARATKELEKRNKQIEKAQKNLKKKGGAFSSAEEKKKKEKKQTRELFKPKEEEGIVPLTGGAIGAPITGKGTFTEELKKELDKKIKVGFREAFADQAGGIRGANMLFAFGKNPKGFATGLLRTIPFIGGIVAATEFGQAIIAELEKLDRFFKKFIDIIDDRINQLRNKIEVANIRAGNTQQIFTTRDGGTEPRESYNTFNQFNEDRLKFESDFAIRSKSGV